MHPTHLIRTLAAATLLCGLAACSQDGSGTEDGKLSVVAAFYPLRFVAERIGGDAVSLTDLTKAGAEPHDLELSAAQVATVSDADVVVYLGGFQPAVDEAVDQHAGDKGFDVASVQPLRDTPAGSEESGKDPHVWLDPTLLATIADRLADRLSTVDRSRAGAFRDRATALRTELERLDADYRAGLTTCQRRQLVTSHAAFGYLAARYNLEQIAIAGLSPDEEPSAQRLAELTALAKRDGVTTIFFETLTSPRLSETLAREAGARTDVLDPIEGLTDEGNADYVSVMRDNLRRLRAALGCT